MLLLCILSVKKSIEGLPENVFPGMSCIGAVLLIIFFVLLFLWFEKKNTSFLS